MSLDFPPTIKAIFTTAGPAQQPVAFVWRSISRKGRPFLLLPDAGLDIRTSLGLYSPQRKRAKIWRALLPLFFRGPVKIWFDRVEMQADAASEIMQFLAQQSGVLATQLKAPAVKFGGVAQRSRLALLVSDETNRPVKVIKVGLNQAGREATDREADLLEKLPLDKLGCIRQTGRICTPAISAFATDYFPGVSPEDDAGMEHLFHSWLNPGSPQPIETLATWQEMATATATANPTAWQSLTTALAGKKIRTTLFHGDFAPWNIRAINSQNLQVFDWERGHLQGIPAWDWFHFIVQTSILARRLSVPRVAAELEQLLYSYRFKEYARVAGIRDIAKPLLLAYLLHQKHVIKPLEGGATTAKLYEFLSARWQIKSPPAAVSRPPAAESAPAGLWVAAQRQLKSAADQWVNLFWEPSLNFRETPSLPAQIAKHWPVLLLAILLLAAVTITQYLASTHLMFLPLYLVICILLTWQSGRRFGGWAATVAAALGPLVVGIKDPGYGHLGIFLWNTVMRFIILQMGVLFTHRIREQKDTLHLETGVNLQTVNLANNWAVLLASILFLIGVAGIDFVTDPHVIFLPLYLFPCMLVTLVFNFRWGIGASLIANIASAWVEYDTNSQHTMLETFGWNFAMRFLMFVAVIALLNRIRKEHILFSPHK